MRCSTTDVAPAVIGANGGSPTQPGLLAAMLRWPRATPSRTSFSVAVQVAAPRYLAAEPGPLSLSTNPRLRPVSRVGASHGQYGPRACRDLVATPPHPGAVGDTEASSHGGRGRHRDPHRRSNIVSYTNWRSSPDGRQVTDLHRPDGHRRVGPEPGRGQGRVRGRGAAGVNSSATRTPPLRLAPWGRVSRPQGSRAGADAGCPCTPLRAAGPPRQGPGGIRGRTCSRACA